MDLDQIVQCLADGRWHHVDDAGQCQTKLYDVGLTTEIAADGRCRLTQSIELLDAGRIRSLLKQAERVTVDVVGEIDSTNTQLQKRPAPARGHGEVLLAEYQRAGRGRQGRSWLSPYAGGVCLSAAWQFSPLPQHLGTLSLAVGVGLLRALAGQGVSDIKLKWPNDILYGDRKLGGILIDLIQSGDAMHVVAGIGINVALTARDNSEIGTGGGIRAVALNEIDAALAARRNQLAAAVINSVIEVFMVFQDKGFDPFRQEWNHADGLNGCAVHVAGPASSLDGQALGVDDSGALLVRAGTVTHRLFSGDVRVRMS